jgi:hypothetical protein
LNLFHRLYPILFVWHSYVITIDIHIFLYFTHRHTIVIYFQLHYFIHNSSPRKNIHQNPKYIYSSFFYPPRYTHSIVTTNNNSHIAILITNNSQGPIILQLSSQTHHGFPSSSSTSKQYCLFLSHLPFYYNTKHIHSSLTIIFIYSSYTQIIFTSPIYYIYNTEFITIFFSSHIPLILFIPLKQAYIPSCFICNSIFINI